MKELILQAVIEYWKGYLIGACLTLGFTLGERSIRPWKRVLIFLLWPAFWLVALGYGLSHSDDDEPATPVIPPPPPVARIEVREPVAPTVREPRSVVDRNVID